LGFHLDGVQRLQRRPASIYDIAIRGTALVWSYKRVSLGKLETIPGSERFLIG
jgi:hypothetical protein